MTEITADGAWVGVRKTRRSRPRSTPAVRARVVHTTEQKRRLEIFITQPVYSSIGWTVGGVVAASFRVADGALLVRLMPSHAGLRAIRTKKSPTLRVAVAGAPIVEGLCAGTRKVEFSVDGQTIIARLPISWAALATSDAEAA